MLKVALISVPTLAVSLLYRKWGCKGGAAWIQVGLFTGIFLCLLVGGL